MAKKCAAQIFLGTLSVAYLLLAPTNLWAMAEKPPVAEKPPLQESGPLPPLTLEDCYQLALKQSETLAIRKQDIEIAEAQFYKAAGEAIGDVRFVITDTRQDAPKPKVTPPPPPIEIPSADPNNPDPIIIQTAPSGSGSDGSFGSTFNARHRRERKFVITQPLFQGFRSLGALAGAGSLKRQRTQERIRAEELLFLDVAEAFYQVMRYQKDIEILEEIHQLFQNRIVDLEARERIGRSRLSEVVSARSRMRIIESDLARSRGALKVAQHILEFLSGIPIDLERLEEEPLETDLSQSLAQLLPASEDRADVQAAEAASKTARSSVVIAQSELWPDISLENNQYVKREGFQRDFDWDLLFKFDIPIFQGGRALGEVKEALSEWRKAKLSHSLVKRQAELEIEEAYEHWSAAADQSKSLELAVKESQENYRLQQEEYSRNLVSNLDVLAALESLNQTQRDANQVFYEMKISYWRLKVAQGEVL